MSIQGWTFLIVGLSFALYIGIALRARAASTKEFYVAGTGVPPIANGMATAADWMSAASFISMAGLISFLGYDGSVYLMGWTGGYVLLALLLAPYLRKFGKFTVPDFIGDRYYSSGARVVAVFCAIFISFTYVAGQMRGVGIVFSRFLEVPIGTGVLVGMAIVFFYAVLGGMKGITYTQVAQYCVLIFAYMVPAIFISLMISGHAIPQLGLGGEVAGAGVALLDRLDGLHEQLGFSPYTGGSRATIDVFFITAALMVGTAGLPHVIVRFYTVPRVRDARSSVGWALLFIALLYTTAPAVAAFARVNLIETVEGAHYEETAGGENERSLPAWFRTWEDTGLLAWVDKDGDGRVAYRSGAVFAAREGQRKVAPVFTGERGAHGERLLANEPTANRNELYVDRDIMVLANPEIARLPNWIVGLVAAGGLAAALSTAAGLLLVVSSAVSHDLLKRSLLPSITEAGELKAARISAALAVCVAGYLGVHPPGFVAEVVAFAFGLAAASFFPAIIMGIFWRRMNREGAVSGMLVGIGFTAAYIIHFKFVRPEDNTPENWWLGISPEGIGTVGMLINFAVAAVVSRFTPPPPEQVQELVEHIRIPKAARTSARDDG
ncbi:MAG: cation acetate symporter [Planctomycetota bacterium]|jgi:cation/acetate symporter|nr:cation acetate symporter [Planctomycetota bacterium]MDP6763417.1 cation acetate symporter [Planctomycetota bacterium]MDP6989062.1 cation acetate symporter [Planctomycetota bacterium]